MPRKSLPDPKHLIHFLRVRLDGIECQRDIKRLRLFNVTKEESMEVLDLSEPCLRTIKTLCLIIYTMGLPGTST